MFYVMSYMSMSYTLYCRLQ